MKKYLIRQIIILIIGLILLFCGMCIASALTNWVEEAYALDRCQDYVTDIRIQHCKYFGLSFPYWYGVGQAKQESNCRADITAFDAGMGLTQFMPATWKMVEGHIGKLNPYNPENSIRAQAWYMWQLQKENWDGRLFLAYMFYNSGFGTIRKEYLRSVSVYHCKSADYELMKLVCKRRVLALKNGRLLDLCQVGYDYPKQIYKYSQKYKLFADDWRYW